MRQSTSSSNPEDVNKTRKFGRQSSSSPPTPAPPRKYTYHKYNDLSLAQGLDFKPSDAVAKHGPGVTRHVEQEFGTCRLLRDFEYKTWADAIAPSDYRNVIEGLSEVMDLLPRVAANGTQGLTHEDVFLAVQFLLNVRNDDGETPPNILNLVEHLDLMTRDDGLETFEPPPEEEDTKIRESTQSDRSQ